MSPRLCTHSRKVGREHLNFLQIIYSKGTQDNKEKCKIQIDVEFIPMLGRYPENSNIIFDI
jgi:hypothetical protein